MKQKHLPYLFVAIITLVSCNKKQTHESHYSHESHEQTSDSGSDSTRNEADVWAAPTNRMVISSQAVIKPVMLNQPIPVKAYGYIALDERRSNQVAVRAGGRVEKLYVKFENQYVRKGARIMDLYSPDLNAIQQELLYTHKSDPNGELMKHAAHKLKLLGVTDQQINEIMRTEKTTYTLPVFSPHEGYIFYAPSTAQSSRASMPQAQGRSGMGGGMSSQQSQQQGMSSASSGPVREGAYVAAGQTLFWINDVRQVWGILSVENVSQDELSISDSVHIVSEIMPEQVIKTVIRFIEPQFSPGQKFVQVRVYLPNDGYKLRINSLLDATVYSSVKEALTLPASSVLYLGKREAVWKKVGETEGGSHVFQIQFVKTRAGFEDKVIVLEGLSAQDEVAADAGYLMDRESLVKPQ